MRLLGYDDFEDFSNHSQGMFRNIIHPDDFERVMVERGMKLMNASPDSYITCYFRVITKTGEVKQAKAQARFRNHPTYGDLFFVMLMETSADDGCMTCGEPPVS